MENAILAMFCIIALVAFFGTLIVMFLLTKERSIEEDTYERLNRVFREVGYMNQASLMTRVLKTNKTRHRSLMYYGILSSFILGMVVVIIYRILVH